MSACIDAHQHFWIYDLKEFKWVDQSMAAIRRDFLPSHLEAQTSGVGVDGVISVQARESLEETRWLLKLAEENHFIKGVVGWAPLTASDLRDELEPFLQSGKLRAVREICQGQPPGFMLRPKFLSGVKVLGDLGLAYDILIKENQLQEAIQFVDYFPNQVFILDHLAKPGIRGCCIKPWAEKIVELSKRENVFCKVSGLVTEADWYTWTGDQLRPYFEIALEAFGAKRIMFGSDWPVSLVASDYGRWHATVEGYISSLSVSECSDILGNTAVRAYRLGNG